MGLVPMHLPSCVHGFLHFFFADRMLRHAARWSGPAVRPTRGRFSVLLMPPDVELEEPWTDRIKARMDWAADARQKAEVTSATSSRLKTFLKRLPRDRQPGERVAKGRPSPSNAGYSNKSPKARLYGRRASLSSAATRPSLASRLRVSGNPGHALRSFFRAS